MIANAQSRAEIEKTATQIRTSSMSRERLVSLLEMVYEYGRIDKSTELVVGYVNEARDGLAESIESMRKGA